MYCVAERNILRTCTKLIRERSELTKIFTSVLQIKIFCYRPEGIDQIKYSEIDCMGSLGISLEGTNIIVIKCRRSQALLVYVLNY